ncbi:uncharacterized protein MELLADRAFT_103442 [Melampsora larici-populina 98AG31]|uniref:5-formyltetrahydrofolate cyclo-ligase n=1 Tax=Melampsora larici-populina (strain 98AG31 / pathotype 3-4-7) TaxID=747676 RepID=F4RBH0_MELLP|nr:uncharacterized protein MELLADRAFT_103442 [Melampsora larici-populina 98AG31]EGG10084.1 hypothetical protein MELLADRAFT_103442 [Melampsora larici-populina 98AG31]
MATSSSAMGMGVTTLKSVLRKQIRTNLSQLDETSIIQQSKSVCKIIKESNWYTSSKKIGCYLSMKNGELRTDEIILDAFSSGKEVYIPYCSSKTEMRMLRLENQSGFSNLLINRWGVREYLPSQVSTFESVDESLDLLLMPGLGFDRSGGRLGHGRGYYDRYLSKLKASSNDSQTPMPLLVGLGLTEQILPIGLELPTCETDHNLDLLVGPEGLIKFSTFSS